MNDHLETMGQRSWRDMLMYCTGTAADRRNQIRFLVWMFAWAVSYVLATWALTGDADTGRGAAVTMAAIPVVLGIIALLAYLRFLREADELLQRIQLEGLAIGFGAGAIFGLSYQILERAGAPQAEVGNVVTVMMIAWALGQLNAMRRFR